MNSNNDNYGLKLFGLPAEQGRWLLIALGIVVLLCLGTIQSWTMFREVVEELFYIESTQTQLPTEILIPYAVVLLSFAVIMPITGFYIDRIGIKKIVALAGLIIGIGYILSSFATTISTLTLTYGIILGTGIGIAYGVPIFVAVRWFPDQKWLAVGLTIIGFRLSPAFTAPFADDLFDDYGVRKTLLILGTIFTTLILIFSNAVKLPPQNWQPKSKNIYQIREISKSATCPDMLKSRYFYWLWICCLIGILISITAIRISIPVAQEIIKVNSVLFTNTIVIFTVVSSLSCPIFAWVTERFSPKYVVITTYILLLIASILMIDASQGEIATYLIAFCLFCFCLAAWLAIGPIVIFNLYNPKKYAQNYGIFFTAYAVGVILGTLVSIQIRIFLGNYIYVFYAMALLAGIGIVIATVSLKQDAIVEEIFHKNSPSLWSEIKADAIANGGTFSYKRLIKLFLLHSGFQLLLIFRVQKRIRNRGSIGEFLGDLLLKFASDKTGCHIYPTATLEGGIHFPHAIGIVIGAEVVIHSGATIYQNVTLGRSNKDCLGYPELCEGCTVYCGAVLLGKITIGKNAIVGANAVVLQSVPDRAIAVGIPAKIIKKDLSDSTNT